MRCVTYYHRYGHRFAERTAEAKDHSAEQTFPGVAKHRDARHLPSSCAERVRGFALQIRNAAQYLTRNRRNDRQNHNRNDDSTGQHAWAVNRAAEKRSPPEYSLQEGKWMIAQPWDHDENSPQAENYAGNRGQHFDQRDDRLPDPERREFRQINRRRNAQRHGDN